MIVPSHQAAIKTADVDEESSTHLQLYSVLVVAAAVLALCVCWNVTQQAFLASCLSVEEFATSTAD
jgi:hypothetical protein